MRAFAVGLLVLVGCAADADDDSGGKTLVCPAEAQACGVRDGGFELRCTGGAIEVADLTTTAYCRPGTSEELCQSEPAARAPVATCNSGCREDYRYFDTYDEYQSFDPQTLCQ